MSPSSIKYKVFLSVFDPLVETIKLPQGRQITKTLDKEDLVFGISPEMHQQLITLGHIFHSKEQIQLGAAVPGRIPELVPIFDVLAGRSFVRSNVMILETSTSYPTEAIISALICRFGVVGPQQILRGVVFKYSSGKTVDILASKDGLVYQWSVVPNTDILTHEQNAVKWLYNPGLSSFSPAAHPSFKKEVLNHYQKVQTRIERILRSMGKQHQSLTTIANSLNFTHICRDRGTNISIYPGQTQHEVLSCVSIAQGSVLFATGRAGNCGIIPSLTPVKANTSMYLSPNHVDACDRWCVHGPTPVRLFQRLLEAQGIYSKPGARRACPTKMRRVGQRMPRLDPGLLYTAPLTTF